MTPPPGHTPALTFTTAPSLLALAANLAQEQSPAAAIPLRLAEPDAVERAAVAAVD
jgi:hypothetical protein